MRKFQKAFGHIERSERQLISLNNMTVGGRGTEREGETDFKFFP